MNRLYVGSLLCLLLPLAGLNAAEDAGSRGIVDTLETAAGVAKVVGPPLKAVGGAVIGRKSKRIADLEVSSEVQTKKLTELENRVETVVEEADKTQETVVAQGGALEGLKKQIKTVSDKMPNAKHTKGFARQDAVDALQLQVDGCAKDDPKDPVVRQGQLNTEIQRATAAFVRYDPENPILLKKPAIAYLDAQFAGENGNSVARQDQVDVLQKDLQALRGIIDQKASQAALDDLKLQVNSCDPENPLVLQNEAKAYVAQELDARMVGVITMQHVQAALKYFAKQSALGGAAYCSSPVIESLLRSAGMENEYIELKTISVPTTTFLISLGARCATKIYDDKLVLLPEVAKEAAYDAGTSAAVMGLKSFFCDDQMCKEIDEKMSEKNRTAAYAFSYGMLRSILALFV